MLTHQEIINLFMLALVHFTGL